MLINNFSKLFEYRSIECSQFFNNSNFNLLEANKSLSKNIISIRKKNKQLYIIVPHYQTSYCTDDCAYCGFKKSNKVLIRKRLDNKEFTQELNLLLDWGYRVIELVYGTDSDISIDDIAYRIELAHRIAKKRELAITIGLNANVCTEQEYKTLYNSGLNFFVLWMETYNQKDYQRWHKKGTPKYDFLYRKEGYDRAISAGIKKYGMGVLLGLSSWKEDVLALMNHGLELEEEYGLSPYILGVPRMKQSMKFNANNIIHKVNELEYEFILNLYRSIFPKAKLFLNTREDYNTNIKNMYIGGDLFTIDCATFPGAYLNQNDIKNGQMQFKTDFYPRNLIIKDLEERGFKLNFKW